MNTFFPGYTPSPGIYCEAFNPDGTIRPHWQSFIQTLESMPPGEFEKQILESRKILGKHGATYNLFSDGGRKDRPWELDLIPALIPTEEWRSIEQGLIQRATLLNAMLKDIYTDQTLIQDGLLPPEAVMAFPEFMRPCKNMVQADRPFLTFLAVNMVRTATGQWQVVNDLTQIPEGLGFSLENRLIVSQVISRLFHQNRVMRLAPFFISLKEQLRQTGVINRTDPEIFMLSAGPGTETYFEQALLSQYLGYPMVESGDLTVRDNRVFVKMLGGLEPVDVLLRYVRDQDCDPLTLRTNAMTGVPGLIQAVRGQSVAVANPVGRGPCGKPGVCTLLPGDLQTPFKPGAVAGRYAVCAGAGIPSI